MKIRTISALGAALAVLAACGPTQSQVEQSIVDEYTNHGAEEVSVSLQADNDGGYSGQVTFREPNSGQTMTHNCTVEAPDGNEAAWSCVP